MKTERLREILDEGSAWVGAFIGIGAAMGSAYALHQAGVPFLGTTLGSLAVMCGTGYMGIIASDKIIDKICNRRDYLANQEKIKSALDKAKRNPQKYHVIELDNSIIKDIDKSFVNQNGKCMEATIYNKDGTLGLSIWSSNSEVLRDYSNDKTYLILQPNQKSNVHLFTIPKYNSETIEIRAEELKTKQDFISHLNKMVEGFKKSVIPDEYIKPTRNRPVQTVQEQKKDKPLNLTPEPKVLTQVQGMKI